MVEPVPPPPDPPEAREGGKKRKADRAERVQYPRSCPHCGKSFPSSTRYHKHVYFHTAERKFKCDHPGCEKSYKRKVDLEDHQKVHLAVKPFRCISSCCNKTFARKSDLMSHVKCAHNGLTCEACGLRFRKKCKLEKHWKLVHPNIAAGEKVPPGVCPECGKLYASHVHLLLHIQNHHQANAAKKYKCNSCDETFSKFLDMVRHRKAKHPKSFTCEKCGSVYKTADQLKRHKNAAHDDVVVRCPYAGCEYTFMSKPAMKLHVRVVHLQMKDFKCRHCNKDFAYKGVLGRHIRTVHKLEPSAEELEPSRSSGVQIRPPMPWCCEVTESQSDCDESRVLPLRLLDAKRHEESLGTGSFWKLASSQRRGRRGKWTSVWGPKWRTVAADLHLWECVPTPFSKLNGQLTSFCYQDRSQTFWDFVFGLCTVFGGDIHAQYLVVISK